MVYRQEEKPSGAHVARKLAMAVVLAGLLGVMGVGLYRLMTRRSSPPPSATPPDRGYLGTVIGSLHKAEMEACRGQLESVYKTLEMYAQAHDGQFPPSLEAAYQSSELATPYVQCPGREHVGYRYLPGQSVASLPESILVYEETPGHQGQSMAVRVNGRVELLGPEALAAAVEQTRAATQRTQP